MQTLLPLTTAALFLAATTAAMAGPATGDWNGLYVGASADLVGTDTTWHATTDPSVNSSVIEGQGVGYGLEAMYLRDLGHVVVGAELQWASLDAAITGKAGGDEVEIGALSSVGRAKIDLGYDMGRFLPYVTVGGVRAAWTWDPEISPLFENASTGWTVGVGALYAVNDRFVIGAELLQDHIDGPRDVAGDDGYNSQSTFGSVSLRAAWRF